VAVLVSQVGVQVDPGAKAVSFVLFIYAAGYECHYANGHKEIRS
jgi:putative transport protein